MKVLINVPNLASHSLRDYAGIGDMVELRFNLHIIFRSSEWGSRHYAWSELRGCCRTARRGIVRYGMGTARSQLEYAKQNERLDYWCVTRQERSSEFRPPFTFPEDHCGHAIGWQFGGAKT